MKLDQECVRDILLYMENELPMNAQVKISSVYDEHFKNDYSLDQVLYTASKLHEANLIQGVPFKFDIGLVDFVMQSISYEGHQLLDTIRDPKVWEETKNVTKKLSSVSLPVLMDVAKTIVMGKMGL